MGLTNAERRELYGRLRDLGVSREDARRHMNSPERLEALQKASAARVPKRELRRIALQDGKRILDARDRVKQERYIRRTTREERYQDWRRWSRGAARRRKRGQEEARAFPEWIARQFERSRERLIGQGRAPSDVDANVGMTIFQGVVDAAFVSTELEDDELGLIYETGT